MMISFILFVIPFTIETVTTYGPLSEHFMHHMNRRPKRNDHVIRQISTFDETGSFGGKMFPEQKIAKTPIVFVHGNSDSALRYGDGVFQSGWNAHLNYFTTKGYALSELYGITYGDRNISTSYTRHFNCGVLLLHRRFFESVLSYTQSDSIHVIAHSMGVSVARKAIQGGTFSSNGASCDIGPNISDRIGTFISLAAANYGMCPCQYATAFPACGMETGFYPGSCKMFECSSEDVHITNKCSNVSYSQSLMDMNDENKKDAEFVASLWSDDDEVLGKGNLVWGRHTSLVPFSDTKKIYRGLKHNDVKLLTIDDQYKLIQDNEIRYSISATNQLF